MLFSGVHVELSWRRWLTGIALLAFLAQVALAVGTESWDFSSRRQNWAYGFEMGRIASAIAAGDGFAWPGIEQRPGPTAWMPPVYPFIMAGVFKLFGTYSTASALVLLLFQSLVSVGSCVLLFFVSRRLFGVQAGLLAALMLALYPPALHFAVQKLWSTPLFLFGLLLVILQLFSLSDDLSEGLALKKSVLTGFSLGMTSLVDPIIFAFWPFALLWLLWRGTGTWKPRVIAAVVVGLTLIATISPWLIRNYVVFDRFVFIKSNFAFVLWGGNVGSPGDRWLQALTPADKRYLQSADDGQRSAFYRDKALALIKSQPLQLVRRTAHRFVHYWRLTKSKPRLESRIATGAYWGILGLGIVGVALSVGRRRDVYLPLLALLTLPIPYYLTVVRLLHYRFPAEALLVIFGSYALYRLYEWYGWSASSRRPLQNEVLG